MAINSEFLFIKGFLYLFKDAMLTGAIVDRLAHKAHIMDISRETSHRYEETIAWLSNKS